jgi:hypothetical protein
MAGRDGISRVVLIYRPENLGKAAKEFTDALNIRDFEGPYDLAEIGVRVVISWTAGIELIAPMQSGTYSAAMWEVLKQRGEGMFNLVYRVRNLERAEAHAAAHGYPRRGEYIYPLDVEQSWRDRFRMLKEASLASIAGTAVTLIQIDPTRRAAIHS